MEFDIKRSLRMKLAITLHVKKINNISIKYPAINLLIIDVLKILFNKFSKNLHLFNLPKLILHYTTR